MTDPDRRPPLSGGAPSGDGDRAVAPVVGKSLEIAVLLLFVGLLATGLFGTAVPEYRTGAGVRVAERSIAATAHAVAAASDPPPALREGRLVRTIDLPDAIRGARYRVRAADGGLVLTHPHPSIGGRQPLAVGADVTVRGTVGSAGIERIVAHHRPNGTVVELGGEPG